MNIYHIYIRWGDEASQTDYLIASSIDRDKAQKYLLELENNKVSVFTKYFAPSNAYFYIEEGELI